MLLQSNPLNKLKQFSKFTFILVATINAEQYPPDPGQTQQTSILLSETKTRTKRADFAADFGASDHCSCKWTQWMNSHDPLQTKNQNEHETAENLRKEYSFCSHPTDVQCRAVNDHGLSLEKDKHGCTLSGFTCNLFCFDFEIRYQCCECIPDDMGPRFRIHLQPQSIDPPKRQEFDDHCLFIGKTDSKLRFGPHCNDERSVFTWVNNNKLKQGTKCLMPETSLVNSFLQTANCNEEDQKQNFALQEDRKGGKDYYSQVRLLNRYRFINVDFSTSKNEVKMHYSANSKGSKFVAKLVSRRSTDLEKYPLSAFKGKECTGFNDDDPNAIIMDKTCSFGNFVGSECQKECKAGFSNRQVENIDLRCEVTGDLGKTQWLQTNKNEYIQDITSFEFPKCNQIGCDSGYIKKSTFANGQIQCSKDNLAFSVCTFSCKKGYRRDGDEKITCDSDGSWHGDKPFCRQVQCPKIDISHDARLSLACTKSRQFEYGSTCELSCSEGYKIHGPSKSICQLNGKWSDDFKDSEVSCGKTHCPEIKISDSNGLKFSCDQGRGIGSTCTFSCDGPRYEMGSAGPVVKSRCQRDGTWSSSDIPKCFDMSCFQWHTHDVNLEVTCRETNLKRSRRDLENDEYSDFLSGNDDYDSFGYASDDYSVYSNPITPENINSGLNSDSNSDFDSDLNPINLGEIQPARKTGTEIRKKSSSPSIVLPNTRCEISCQPGYKLKGARHMKCEPYREINSNEFMSHWTDGITGHEPDIQSCEIIQCITVDKFEHGEFKCYQEIIVEENNGGRKKRSTDGKNVGYSYFGNMYLESVRNRRDLSDTGIAPVALNGDSRFHYGSRCNFECMPGFTLHKEARSITCGENGEWSYPPSTGCKRVQCSNLLPNSLENGKIICSKSNQYSSICKFQCDPNFKLDEATTQTECTDDGIWSDNIPNCIPIICTDPYALSREDSQMRRPVFECSNSYNVGSKCEYSCQDGYEIYGGSAVSVCGQDGKWDEGAPMCRGVTCDDLSPASQPPNTNEIYPPAKLMCSPALATGQTERVYPTNCVFYCEDGYYPPVVNKIECDKLGKWSGEQPLCRPIRCTELPTRHGTIVECSKDLQNEYKSVCEFSCKEGYTMSGMERIECERSGWTFNPPICDKVSCPALPQVENGILECSEEWKNNKMECKIECQAGFHLVGEFTDITCEAPKGETVGKWNREIVESKMPKCEALQCGGLTNSNGVACKTREGNIKDSADCEYFGCQCEKKCRTDEAIKNGVSSATCMLAESGNIVGWSGELGVCEQVLCPSLSTIRISNSHPLKCSNGDIKNSVCDVICKDKFRLVGPKNITCSEIGQWSNSNMICEEITCSSHIAGFSDIANGKVSNTDGSRAGSVYNFSCDDGFKLIGEKEIRCEYNTDWLDGKWSHDVAPKCEPITCQKPMTVNQQTQFGCKQLPLTNNRYNYKSECKYSCTDPRNYVLIGDGELTCSSDENRNGHFVTSVKVSKSLKNVRNKVLGASSKISLKNAARCVQITCPALPNVRNGNLDCDSNVVNEKGDFAVDSVCRVSCDMTHNADWKHVTCTMNGDSPIGHWVDSTGTKRKGFICRLRDKKILFSPCVVPETLFTNKSTPYITPPSTDCNYAAKTCEITCPDAFEVKPFSKTFCDKKKKKWNRDLSNLACHKKKCPEIPPKENMIMECEDSSYVGSKCTLKCADEYTLKNTKSGKSLQALSTTCDLKGNWSPRVPASLKCVQTRCFLPILYAELEKQIQEKTVGLAYSCDRSSGTNCNLQCPTGFQAALFEETQEISNAILLPRTVTLDCLQGDENESMNWGVREIPDSEFDFAEISKSSVFKPVIACREESKIAMLSMIMMTVLVVLVIVAVVLFIMKKPDLFKKSNKPSYADEFKIPTSPNELNLLIDNNDKTMSPDGRLDITHLGTTRTDYTQRDYNGILTTYNTQGNRDSGIAPESSGRGSGMFDSPNSFKQSPEVNNQTQNPTETTPNLTFQNAVNTNFISQGTINQYSKIIPYSKLDQELDRKRDKQQFNQEFSQIPKSDVKYPTNSAKNNLDKNRYSDVIPYDYNIIGTTGTGPSGPYVNASYVNGLDQPKKFIAAMGPMDNTVFDFWKMIIDEQICIIVMLTNTIEDGQSKCAQYFPLHSQDLQIDIVEEILFGEFIQRRLRISTNGHLQTREVCHLQFTGWPDFSIPKSSQGILKLIRRVKSEIDSYTSDFRDKTLANQAKNPILVHCSAGAGRTGTFIALDIIMDHITNHDGQACDFFGLVCNLRKQRPQLVQSFQQYQFVWQAANDVFKDGDTEIDVADLVTHYQMLTDVLPGNMTGLTHEFEKVRKLRLAQKQEMYAALRDEELNFATTLVPYDYNRVKLADDTADYINASFIDGYILEESFIATQTPLINTQNAFWQMIWENNIEIVVCLENPEEIKTQYFPVNLNDRLSMTSNIGIPTFQITCTRHSHTDPFVEIPIPKPDSFILRTLSITLNGVTKTVKHFQILEWYHQDGQSPTLPPENKMIDMLLTIERSQEESMNTHFMSTFSGSSGFNSGPQNTPLVVHCEGGCGRTGTFLTVTNSVERIKAEANVDIFQTVKRLREQRPHMIQSDTQYKFCYLTIMSYINSMCDYANFK